MKTDNPKILLGMGNLVSEYSCQNYLEWASQLRALFWYVIDAWVKALLSFEIKKTDFENVEVWEYFKEKIKNNDYNLEFDEYKLLLKVDDVVLELKKACYRNIMKLWKSNETPYIFLEKSYKSICWSKKDYVKGIHNQIIEEKQNQLKESNYFYSGLDRTINFPETRNPWGIYCDWNGQIEEYEYKIKK